MSSDWRYWVVYEGRVRIGYDAEHERAEQEATDAALADHESIVPIVEVEPLEGGEGT